MIGLIIMAVASGGIWAAVGLEIAFGESIYMIMMKVFPWMLALGAFIYTKRRER